MKRKGSKIKHTKSAWPELKNESVEILYNGELKATVADPNEAFVWLLKHQGGSTDYALRYGGCSVRNK